MALLIYFSNRIVVYILIYTICDVCAFFGTRDVDRGVAISLKRTRDMKSIIDPSEQIYKALADYYLNKPQLLRIFLSSLGRVFALVLVLITLSSRPGADIFAKLTSDPPDLPTCSAYILVLISSIFAEIQITIWRVNRNKSIQLSRDMGPRVASSTL